MFEEKQEKQQRQLEEQSKGDSMNKKRQNRISRHRRIRSRVSGTANRPRLCVYRSNTALIVQLIDDVKRVTIASCRAKGANIASATMLGETMAKEALKNKIQTIVFDRGGYQYHGVIKALADSARKGGLQF